MTQDDSVELSRLFTLWLAGLPGESPMREVAEEIDKLIAPRCRHRMFIARRRGMHEWIEQARTLNAVSSASCWR